MTEATKIKSSAEALEKLGDILTVAESELSAIIEACPAEYQNRVEEIIFESLQARVEEYFKAKQDKSILARIAKSGLILPN